MIRPDSTETLLHATRFSVERWRFGHTAVGVVDREVIVHPGAVLVVPVLSDTEIVMIRNVRHAVGRELLELPAGTLEAGEQPATCAARELQEETGYRAALFEPLCEFFTTPGFCTELMHCYVASGLTLGSQNLDDTELIHVEVVRFAEAWSMIDGGSIVDAKTIAALAAYRIRRGVWS